MTEPNFSINFSARMLSAEACGVGDALVFDSAAEVWKVATAANRAAANARSQAVALTAYGGSAVGRVSYQSSGVVATSISDLGAGASQLVRVSSTGRIERIASFTAGDDVIGYAEPDGRVHLHFGLPWQQILDLSFSGASVSGTGFVRVTGGAIDAAASPVNLAGGATHVTGIVPVGNGGTGLSAAGTSGNVLTSNGSAWVSSAPAASVTVNGATKDLLFKTSATVIDPIGTGIWTREASGRVNVTSSGFMTFGAAGSAFPSEALIRVENIVSEGDPIAVIAGRHNGTDSVGLYSTDSGWQLAGGIGLDVGVQQTTFIFGWGVTFEDGFLSNNLITVGGTSSMSSDNVSSASFRSTASDIATTGVLRCANNTAMVAVRNAINTADAEVLKVAAGGAETLSFWTTNASFGDITIKTPNLQKVSFEDASIWRMLITATGIECAVPLGGSATASLPFRWRQTSIAKSDATDLTLNATQYQCAMVRFTGAAGGTFNMIVPNTTGAFFIIDNANSSAVTVKISGGTGSTVAAGNRRFAFHNGTDYAINT